MGTGLIIFTWLLALVFPAHGSALPWYVNQPVAQVNIESIGSGLADDNLEDILRTEQGQRLHLGTVRSDVALLAAAGGFASVEALIEPWITTDESGRTLPAVLVRYRVVPARRVGRVDVRGARGNARHLVEDGLGFDLGDTWYQGENLEGMESRIEQSLALAGWPESKVAIDFSEDEKGIRLLAQVDLGMIRRINSVRVGGDVPVSDRQVRRWLADAGVRVGRPLNEQDQQTARMAVVDRLRALGFDRARVNVFIQHTDDSHRASLTVLIAPGSQLVIERKSRSLPNSSQLRDLVGIRAGDQIADSAREDAASRVREWYSARGYLDAEVDIEGQREGADKSTLTVRGKKGVRHWFRSLAWPDDTPIDRSTALAIMREAAPDTLGNGSPDPKGIERATSALQERLRSLGYLDAVVTMDSNMGRSLFSRMGSLPVRWGVPVRMSARVELGELVRLKGLRVLGGIGLEDGLVAQWLENNEGRPLDASNTLELQQQVVQLYEEEGFLDAKAELETKRDRVENSAQVDIRLHPGQPVELRSVVIRGNRRTKQHVIEREIMLDIGQPISPSGLSQTRSNLYDLDLFRLVSPKLFGDEEASQDLLLRVEERSNILLEAGGGISTDQGIRTTGRVTHRNIGGLGQRLTGLGSVGYGWFGDEWRLDTATPVWRAATRYELPYVPGRGGRLVIEGLINEILQEPSWRMSRSGGGLGMNMRLSDRSKAVVGYRVQVRRLVDVDAGMLVNGDPWLPSLGLDEDMEGIPLLTSAPRLVSGGSLLFVHDARDDKFNPRSGGNWSAHLEVGDGVFSGTVTMRASAQVERLVPLGPLVLDLVGGGGIGFAQGRSVTLPLEERFFLGGGTTLRGFKLNSVGPANYAARPEIGHPGPTEPAIDGLILPQQPAHWVATGGDAMAMGTIELRIPFPVVGFHKLDGTSLVVFGDGGHVGFLDPAVVTTSRLENTDPLFRFSFGAGLRIATPVGPASLDIGVNPNPLAEREEPMFLPHLSLGVL